MILARVKLNDKLHRVPRDEGMGHDVPPLPSYELEIAAKIGEGSVQVSGANAHAIPMNGFPNPPNLRGSVVHK